MAGSQLKQLKASLREHGRLGPTLSKKEKKARHQKHRQPELQNEVLIKKAKFDFLHGSDQNGFKKDSAAREQREQARRDGILYEMQRKQKVGGIIDRRFGEDNPDMTLEERAMERFVREKQRSGRKSGIFDLENDEDEEGGLTHLGRPLGLSDDFQDSASNDDVSSEGELRGNKRRRLSDVDGDVQLSKVDADPDRFRSKKEIMEEVIAKSKLHKYERQKVKEDDNDLRAELDAGVADIFALLGGRKAASKISQPADIPMNPDRAALLNGDDREKADKEYDMRLRAMIQDRRSQPASRTKTEQEKAEDEAIRLQMLEQQRSRRMNGEESDDNEDMDVNIMQGDEDFYAGVEGESKLSAVSSLQDDKLRTLLRKQDVEDEDEFDLDHDLIANDSDVEALHSDISSIAEAEEREDEDDEFIADFLTKDDGGRLIAKNVIKSSEQIINGNSGNLPFMYPCPQDLEEMLKITKDIAHEDIPTVVQRIRALYHPGLAEGNKDRLAQFAAVLVEFIPHQVQETTPPAFKVLESLIRHLHSLTKSYPESVSEAIRVQLRLIQKSRPSALNQGDIVLLTAIGMIYPTSDHFHQVVTPAMLTMTRYLEHAIPSTLHDLVQGTYISTLALSYQKLSKRYIPEIVNHSLNTLSMLGPKVAMQSYVPHPQHESHDGLRIQSSKDIDALPAIPASWLFTGDAISNAEEVKLTLCKAQLILIGEMHRLWGDKSSYPEIMAQFVTVLTHYAKPAAVSGLPSGLRSDLLSILTTISTSITQANSKRKPLALHNHRPLAIKQSLPKFEESYNPNKRYDPDTERSESNKLRAEHKKERKAVIREFRKEGRAEAAVQLEEKKARDDAYEKKYRRLVAEIQGEEGAEARKYEREKAARKGRK